VIKAGSLFFGKREEKGDLDAPFFEGGMYEGTLKMNLGKRGPKLNHRAPRALPLLCAA